VGRGEESGAGSGGTEPGGDHGRGGPLALAAGDVDHGQVVVRVPDPLEQVGHAVELEVAGGVEVAVESFVVDPPEQELDRLFVGVDRRVHRRTVGSAVAGFGPSIAVGQAIRNRLGASVAHGVSETASGVWIEPAGLMRSE